MSLLNLTVFLFTSYSNSGFLPWNSTVVKLKLCLWIILNSRQVWDVTFHRNLFVQLSCLLLWYKLARNCLGLSYFKTFISSFYLSYPSIKSWGISLSTIFSTTKQIDISVKSKFLYGIKISELKNLGKVIYKNESALGVGRFHKRYETL